MSIATAAGYRDIGASTMAYIPVIYSPKLLVKYYDASVMAAISNTDYEGEIKKFGDTVRIRTTPDITIRTYTRGQVLQVQTPESGPVDLDIDQGKYWAFVDEDVDSAQTDIKNYVERWTTDASEQLKVNVETDVFAALPAQASSDNVGLTAGRVSSRFNLGTEASPLALSKSDICDYIVDCGTVLDEQNVPETGRWFTLPPWAAGLIKKSDLKDASLAGDGTSIMRNGQLGMIDRFTLYSTNILDVSTETHTPTNMLFGHPSGLTFATQLVKNENVVNPYGFGRLYRGLQVYGYKLVKDVCMGVLCGYKA